MKRIKLKLHRTNGPDMNLDGLRMDKPRMIHNRVVVDVINYDGDLVLSGNADWVFNICDERRYYIENEGDAIRKLGELARIY